MAKRAWPSVSATLRALVISLVLLLQCASAIPGRPLDRHHLATLEGERYVSWMHGALATLGFEPNRDAIKARAISASQRLVALRRSLVAPFDALLQQLGSHQQWALFQVGNGQCFRMLIETRAEDASWTRVYQAQGVDRLELGSELRFRRLRGVYNPSASRGVSRDYDGFVTWLARRVFLAEPRAAELRVRMQRIERGTRATPGRELGYEHERRRSRAEVR